MKAVLVLDIPDDININQLKIGGDGNIYYMRDGEKGSIVGNIKNIKPLPRQKRSTVGVFMDTQAVERGYELGWNACLDEIVGEAK